MDNSKIEILSDYLTCRSMVHAHSGLYQWESLTPHNLKDFPKSSSRIRNSSDGSNGHWTLTSNGQRYIVSHICSIFNRWYHFDEILSSGWIVAKSNDLGLIGLKTDRSMARSTLILSTSGFSHWKFCPLIPIDFLELHSYDRLIGLTLARSVVHIFLACPSNILMAIINSKLSHREFTIVSSSRFSQRNPFQ